MDFENENRIMTPGFTETDHDIEISLRPKTLTEYIGQEKAKENLKIYINAADRLKMDKCIESNDFSKIKTMGKENSSNQKSTGYLRAFVFKLLIVNKDNLTKTKKPVSVFVFLFFYH